MKAASAVAEIPPLTPTLSPRGEGVLEGATRDFHAKVNLRSSTMLGALAAVALVVGTIGATVSVSQNGQSATEEVREPVVEVQAIESVDSVSE
jgi:hypothetical protein